MEFGILAGLVGACAGIASAIAVNRKVRPETESMAITSLRSVLEDLRTEVKRKEEEITKLTLKLELSERQLIRLEQQLVKRMLDT